METDQYDLDTSQGFIQKGLSLHHDQPMTFIICQWQRDHEKPHVCYLCYRLFHAIYFVTTQMYTILTFNPMRLWYIYLTNWSYTLATIQAVLGATMITQYFLGHRTPLKYYKMYWVFQTTALNASHLITFIYWKFVHQKTDPITPATILVHGLNTVMMTTDFFLISHPMKVMHFVYEQIYGVTFITWSYIYYICGGMGFEGDRYIYKILDWRRNPATLIACASSLMFSFVNHLFLWSLHKWRKYLYINFVQNE